MSQLIIEFSYAGAWKHKYGGGKRNVFKTLVVPYSLRQFDWIIGTTIDNRQAWRKKLDEHTKSADYEIIINKPLKEQE